MKKKLVSVLLAAAMVMSLSACGASNTGDAAATDTAETADATEAPAAEATVTNEDTNILRINLASEPDYLDPALNSSVDGGCLACNFLYEAGLVFRLLRYALVLGICAVIVRKYKFFVDAIVDMKV